MKVRCLALIAAGLAFFLPAVSQAREVKMPEQDWKGSQDHPMFSRFTGSVITAYQTLDYEQLIVPLGPYERSRDNPQQRFAKSKMTEGKVTRIVYAAPENKSTLEVFRNYQQALSQAGFQTLFACSAAECDGYRFAQALSHEVINRGVGNNTVMIATLNPVGDDLRHVSAVLKRPAGEVYATVTVSGRPANPVGVYLRIVETQPMQTGQVQVNADAIAKAISAEGKVALYGILFETDSADVRDDSKPALEEMAKFLKSQPKTKVHIVGHTDNTGSLSHNLDLSQRRADAVVKTLTATYSIPAPQLSAKGLASYAPVASNDDEAGRAKNRRVEIVKQ